jgi:hypothetical protein
MCKRTSPLDTLDITSEFERQLVATNYDRSKAYEIAKGKIEEAQIELTAQNYCRSKAIKSARSKYFGQRLAVNILSVVPDSPLKDAYWDMYHCASIKERNEEGKYISKYCRRRHCPTCSRIRTADLIKTYLPILTTWKDAQFVTLTAPTIFAEELSEEIDRRLKAFQQIKDSARKQGIKIRLTRNLEVTYNPTTNKFHPHFHCIVEDMEQAEYLLAGWYQRIKNAGEQGQDIRPFNGDPKSCLEAFKYSNKVSSKTKVREGNKTTTKHAIYFEQADTINCALHGRRAFQTVGFTKKDIPKGDQVEKLMEELTKEAERIYDQEELDSIPTDVAYVWSRNDWYSVIDGSDFAGYEPTEGLVNLMEGKVVDEEQMYHEYQEDKRPERTNSSHNICEDQDLQKMSNIGPTLVQRGLNRTYYPDSVYNLI